MILVENWPRGRRLEESRKFNVFCYSKVVTSRGRDKLGTTCNSVVRTVSCRRGLEQNQATIEGVPKQGQL